QLVPEEPSQVRSRIGTTGGARSHVGPAPCQRLHTVQVRGLATGIDGQVYAALNGPGTYLTGPVLADIMNAEIGAQGPGLDKLPGVPAGDCDRAAVVLSD